MIISDWSLCKNCHFPALYSALKEHVSLFSECPMCSVSLSAHEVQKLPESIASDHLKGKVEAIERGSEEGEVKGHSLKRSTHNVSDGASIDNTGIIIQDAAGLGGLVA
jgi:hypothetical protein